MFYVSSFAADKENPFDLKTLMLFNNLIDLLGDVLLTWWLILFVSTLLADFPITFRKYVPCVSDAGPSDASQLR